MDFRKEDGFTLIELIVTLMIFSVVITSIFKIISYISNFNLKITFEQELFESGRISMDMIETQIRNSDEIKIVIKSNGTFDYLTVFPNTKEEDDVIDHKFVYIKDRGVLTFGRQKLGENIKNMKATFDEENKILSVFIEMDTSLNSSKVNLLRPINFIRQINVSHKIIRK